MKLTRSETRLHDQAVELLQEKHLDTLTVECPHCAGGERDEFNCTLTNRCDHCNWGLIDAREFILRNWRPGATHNVGKGGIFFTPMHAAKDAACFHGSTNRRVLDCCAGIGALGYALMHNNAIEGKIELTCVEIDPEFVEIGRKIVPAATWICGNVFDVVPNLPLFWSAISNPPFGNIPCCKGRSKHFPSHAHFAVMELLLRRCKAGATVIIPDGDHSQEGRRGGTPSSSYAKFKELYPMAYISPESCDPYDEGWHGTTIKAQICNLGLKEGDNPYLDKEEPVKQAAARGGLDMDAIDSYGRLAPGLTFDGEASYEEPEQFALL